MQKKITMITKIEELCMNAWPSLQTNLYDGWVLRFADGYTKRANSINPIYRSDLDLEKKLDYCEVMYSKLSLPTVFKLTEACYPADIDAILATKGYERIDETAVRLLDMTSYIIIENEVNINYSNGFTPTWIESFARCNELNDKSKVETMTKMLNSILGEIICVDISLDNKVVACGFGVIEGGYVGIFDIVVDRAYRGNKYGEAVVRAILNRAKKLEVSTAYLQVVSGNIPAESLYDKLGFEEIYRYWYRKKNNS